MSTTIVRLSLSIFSLSFFYAAFVAPDAKASAVSELVIDGNLNGSVKAGTASDWQFSFYYMSTGERITDFEPLHTKYMHMFVVSQDLEEFSHLHPVYDPIAHTFNLRINSQPIDGDNFNQLRVIQRTGEYHVITEAKIKDVAENIHGMHFVDGTNGPAMGVLPQVEFECNGAPFTKFMDQTGVIQSVESFYKVEISCKPIMMNDFQSAEFVYKWMMKRNGVYRPISDFTHWLHMTGHAVAISLAGDSVGSKVFKHMHNMSPHGSSAPLVFNIDREHGSLVDGAYKVWAQFKRDNRVLTLPVVVSFKNIQESKE